MLIFVFLFFVATFTIAGIFLSIEARQAGRPDTSATCGGAATSETESPEA